MYAAGSSSTDWKRASAPIDVTYVIRKSTPKMRAFLWSSAISHLASSVARYGTRRDLAILNRTSQKPNANRARSSSCSPQAARGSGGAVASQEPDSCDRGNWTASLPGCPVRRRQLVPRGGLGRSPEVAEGVVEGRQRVRARDVELEIDLETRVGDDEPDPIGRLAPEERDLEAVVVAARELSPVSAGGRRCVDGGLR